MKNQLVFEGPFAGWADSLKKRGHVLYTNTLYCYAIKCVVELAELNENKTDQNIFTEKFNQTKEQFNKLFWNGNYLIDWAYKANINTRLSIDGNALSIIFDLISQDKQEKVCSEIIKQNMITPFGIKSVNQPYSWKDSYTPFLFVGLRDYHNGLNWLWLSGIAGIACGKSGLKKEAVKIMNSISELIIKHNTVYEVYTKDAKPVNRLFYKSEKGFAWSAGCFIWCYSALFGSKSK
ncbi:MAG: amylo-alpha-1,6-glucosidase [Candidatus Margulisiibacteriota bacterium]|nr:amylo-alpha-1,6-glucosidase [Candidatus Margulisiibacteriota bacterium]